jgi:hypothetical protein
VFAESDKGHDVGVFQANVEQVDPMRFSVRSNSPRLVDLPKGHPATTADARGTCSRPETKRDINFALGAQLDSDPTQRVVQVSIPRRFDASTGTAGFYYLRALGTFRSFRVRH